MSVGQLLSLPSAATGLAPVSSATAWTFGTPVAVGTLATDIEVIFFNFQNTDIPAVDTLQEILFEITVNGTTELQIPFSMKADSLVGWEKSPPTSSSNNFYLTEPFFIPAGSAVAIKVADSIAAVLTYNGVKILYNELSKPTTALNTPGDASSDSDTTPTLNFTGTDADASMALEYQVQVDTVNTFDSVVGAETSQMSNENASFDQNLPIYGAIGTSEAIGFILGTPSSTFVISSIHVSAAKFQFPTDNVYAEITTTSIDGATLATSDNIAAASFAGTVTLVFSGANKITLNSGTQYFIRFLRTGAWDNVNRSIIKCSTTGASNYIKNSGTWAAAAEGLPNVLGTYALSYVPLISASSSVPDAGFTAGHPFASATPIDYTVQSALTAPDTYYWRVRAARTGSTDYGDWSDIRSFDVTTGGAVANTGFFGFM